MLACALYGATIVWQRPAPAGGVARLGGLEDAEDVEDAWTPQAPEFQALADRIIHSRNPIAGRGAFDELQALIAEPDLDPARAAELRCALANEQLRLGQFDAAILTMDEAVAMLEALPGQLERFPDVYRVRALAHLRQAEFANCISLHNRDCCIYPLEDGGVHAVSQPARLAKADYLRYLELLRPLPGDDSSPDFVTARWLLNIACMALNEYPDGVPPEYLIPPASVETDHGIKRFVDVAPQLGVDNFDLAGGTIVDDFDGDGLLDLVSSTSDVSGPMKAFRNVGDGTFEDVAAAWRLNDQLGGLDIVSADYDNDGRLDILVLRGAWMLDDGRMRMSLLHNDGGRFTDVTRAAGLGDSIAPTQAAAWADFDNDGWLDVYVGHESRKEFKDDHTSYPGQLFRNNRDGTFEDVTAAAGVANDRYAKGVAAGDFDNDGDMDLYVSNVGKNRMYRNDGHMAFTDVASELHMTEPGLRSFACWFFDFDNDGNLDLWVGDYDASVSDVALGYLGAHDSGFAPCLYRNGGDGTFTDVAKSVGLDHAWLPMAANFGDFDNDGWLDIFLGTGNPSYEAIMPNVALLNDGGRRFHDVTRSAGLGHLQKGHGIAFADIDNDGDQDIYNQLGGFVPGDGFRNALFLNPGHDHHFLTIEMVGVQTNRMAVGSRITLKLATPDGPRTLHRAVGCVSSFGGSPRRQEIGLGDATSIESIDVWWPTSGQRQTFVDVPMDGLVRITEGQPQFQRLESQPIPFPDTQ